MLLNCGAGEDSWECLGWKEIKPVNPNGNQPWIFIGRTDTEAEAPIFWPHDGKNWLIRKDPDAGKDWRQEMKGMTEDELVGWHHWLSRREFEQTLGFGDGQGSLTWCSPWCHRESDTTEQLNWSGRGVHRKHLCSWVVSWTNHFFHGIHFCLKEQLTNYRCSDLFSVHFLKN